LTNNYLILLAGFNTIFHHLAVAPCSVHPVYLIHTEKI